MRAQASLEYLFLALAALAMLSVSVFSLSRLESASRDGAGALVFRHDAVMLKNAISEVCALGDGNGRELAFGSPLSAESAKSPHGWVIRISDGDRSLAMSSRCGLDAGRMEKTVYVKNEEGIVSVRAR